jgi:hypothetical protein
LKGERNAPASRPTSIDAIKLLSSHRRGFRHGKIHWDTLSQVAGAVEEERKKPLDLFSAAARE